MISVNRHVEFENHSEIQLEDFDPHPTFIASEKNLKKLALVIALFVFCLFELPLHAQQFDAAFGLGTISSGAPTTSNGLLFPSEKGGLYPSISADFLVTHRAGIEGEFAWRASQGLYGGLEPYRPIFWAINAIWAPRLAKGITAELLGGIGGEDLRFYGTLTTILCRATPITPAAIISWGMSEAAFGLISGTMLSSGPRRGST